jgi:hypothetical protein
LISHPGPGGPGFLFALSWAMPETFTLTVNYKNTDRNYEAELRAYGYNYKIAIMIDDAEILFERDEEGSFRAVLSQVDIKKIPNRQLIQLIAEELERLFR